MNLKTIVSDAIGTKSGKAALHCAGGGVAWLMKQWMHSIHLRIAHYDRSADPSQPEFDQHCIYALWHEYIWVVLPRWSGYRLTLLVSQHRDAEVLTQAARRFGMKIVRGSSTRGGVSAIRRLRHYSKNAGLTITPDGPRGPRRHFALGPVYLASLLNMPLVPVGVGYDRPWRLNTWDRFALPRPGSRVRMVFGPKINVPRRVDKDVLEVTRVQTERLLGQLTEMAEHWAEQGYSLSAECRFGRPPLNRILKAHLHRADVVNQQSSVLSVDQNPCRSVA